jgi:transcriptional regulator MraZ
VSTRFISSATHTIDKSGRTSVPAPFRVAAMSLDPAVVAAGKRGEPRLPQARLYLMPGYLGNSCIIGHSEAGMRALSAAINAMTDRRLKSQLSYAVIAHAEPIQIDEAGRIVVPADLRERYRVAGKAVFVGKLDYFEIWNDAAYADKKRAELSAWDAGGADAAFDLLSGPLLPAESLEAEE